MARGGMIPTMPDRDDREALADAPGTGIDESTPVPLSSAAPHPRAVGYRRLLRATAVSNLADGIGTVAYPWLASLLTRNAVLVAGVSFAFRLPWLLVSLPVGVLIDRVDRRLLLVSSDALRATLTLILGLVVLAHGTSLALLYALVVVLGSAEVVKDNCSQTILPRLVGPEQLERANSSLWLAEGTMNTVVGPWLGGALLGVTTALAFLAGAGTYALSALLAAAIVGVGRPAGPSSGTERRPIRQDVREGLTWLWRHRLLRTLGLFVGILNLTEGMVLGILVLFVQEILGLDAAAFGGLLLDAAVGGLLGAWLGPRLSTRIGQGPTLLIAAMGASPAVIAFSSAFGSVAVMLALANAGGFMWGVITVSLRQLIVPDSLLGRVNSAYRMLAWGTIPIGSLLGGGLVAVASAVWGREVGLRAPFVVAGAINVVVFVIAIPRLTSSRLREAREAAEGQA
jgi:MFS family permease